MFKKYVGALKPVIVLLVGNKLVCIRQLHEQCILLNIGKTCWGPFKQNP